MNAESKTKQVSEWAKMPIGWIQGGGLSAFTNRSLDWMGQERFSRKQQNESIAALKLYLVLCIRTDYETGFAKVTYEELVRLSGMSKPIVASSLKKLEAENLIRRKPQPLREGSSIYLEGWLEENFSGRIPKRWLFDGNRGMTIVRLAELNFSRGTLNLLKVYLALIAFRDRNRNGLAILSYTKLALVTGIGRHLIGDAITLLYHFDLISFRQADFTGDDPDRTNRYLIKGLGIAWTALGQEYPSLKSTSQPSKAAIQANIGFVSKK